MFDSESRSTYNGDMESQTWAMGAAIRWRTDLKTGDHAEARTFESPRGLWEWVTEYCKKGQRTCMAAHNLGHDTLITQVMDILPALGWRLEWCNLDRNVSSMTWRSDNGTLVLWDTWTWLPLPLSTIAPTVGLRKLKMPPDTAGHYKWEKYCMRDAEILYRVVTDIIAYLKSEDLGNWQPTGAGMSYATWRHKFMEHKVMVHDDPDALDAERKAMHTGRAEAWKHGLLKGGRWVEVDLRNAYVTIASQCDLPCKIKFHHGSLSVSQYRKLAEHYRVLCRVRCTTDLPMVPYHDGSHTLWPVGTFETWLWDTEIELLVNGGQEVSIREAYVYTRQPILQKWALFVIGILRDPSESVSPVVRTWLKHCSRALIGRIAMRSTRWELFGSNPFGHACVTRMVDGETGVSKRLMHVGQETFIESGLVEGRDSLPQVTGWIMAECRSRLWLAMRAAGLDQLAHVDTDSVLVSAKGLEALKAAYGDTWADTWAVKGGAKRVVVYGPRNYRWQHERKTSGVPRKAKEILPNVFEGERWMSVSAAMEAGTADTVYVKSGKWTVKTRDPRRVHLQGSETVPFEV